jgi:hypothetical protein
MIMIYLEHMIWSYNCTRFELAILKNLALNSRHHVMGMTYIMRPLLPVGNIFITAVSSIVNIFSKWQKT